MRFIEGHRLVRVLVHLRVFHDLLVDAVTIGLRPVDDVGENDSLCRLGSHEPREWERITLWPEILSNTLTKFKRTVLAPHLARFLRQAAIGRDVLLGNDQHETIHVTRHSLVSRKSKFRENCLIADRRRQHADWRGWA
jgi:hypothetical protein